MNFHFETKEPLISKESCASGCKCDNVTIIPKRPFVPPAFFPSPTPEILARYAAWPTSEKLWGDTGIWSLVRNPPQL